MAADLAPTVGLPHGRRLRLLAAVDDLADGSVRLVLGGDSNGTGWTLGSAALLGAHGLLEAKVAERRALSAEALRQDLLAEARTLAPGQGLGLVVVPAPIDQRPHQGPTFKARHAGPLGTTGHPAPAVLQAQAYPDGLLVTAQEGDPHGEPGGRPWRFVGATLNARQALALASWIQEQARANGWEVA